jgi:hypothetical protein
MTGLTQHLEITSFAEQSLDVRVPILEAFCWVNHWLYVIDFHIGTGEIFKTHCASVVLRQSFSFWINFLFSFRSI